jgi:hypothetical protein
MGAIGKKSAGLLFFGIGLILAWTIPQGVGRLYERAFAPKLVCPDRIDMGAGEIGKVCHAQFSMANRGRSELVLDQIRTNCGCSGLERERDGVYERVESIRLAPGEHVRLAIRALVQGKPGGVMHNVVYLRTNDPLHLEFKIDACVSKINGGVISDPATLIIGTVPVGSKQVSTVDVLDFSEIAREVERIECTHPERVTARLLPPRKPVADRTANAARAIAAIEVFVHTEKPGPLDGEILIHLKGEQRPPDSLPINGWVRDIVEIAPSELALPRRQLKGILLHTRAICWCSPETALDLEILDAPPQLKVVVTPDTRLKWQKTIEVAIADAHSITMGTFEIRIRATAGNNTTTITIPVTLTEKGHEMLSTQE